MLNLIPLQVVEEQVTPEQLNHTVDQLSESTLALAEAAANFGALKVIFAAFVVFTFILLILFLYQVIVTTRKVEKIHQTAKKLESSLEETESRTIGKAQAGLLLRRIFGSLKQYTKYVILRTRIENHLEMKDVITAKVTRLITNNWTELHSFLSNFECDTKNLSNYIEDEDANALIDLVIDQVYQDSNVFTVGSMEQSVDILLDGMKLETLKDFN